LIRRLFAVDRLSALHHETAEQRHARRAKDSASALADLRAWVNHHDLLVPQKKACVSLRIYD
jgi:hypothetical protein